MNAGRSGCGCGAGADVSASASAAFGDHDGRGRRSGLGAAGAGACAYCCRCANDDAATSSCDLPRAAGDCETAGGVSGGPSSGGRETAAGGLRETATAPVSPQVSPPPSPQFQRLAAKDLMGTQLRTTQSRNRRSQDDFVMLVSLGDKTLVVSHTHTSYQLL